MSKNKIQFQTGYSLFEFFQNYGSNEQCESALFSWKWPNGFRCPNCGSSSYCSLNVRKVYQCNYCHHQTSLTSGTIFANTKLPLSRWFLSIHLVTQSKTGLSALSLKRQIGVSYNTAWSIKQKIMHVMKKRDDSKPLSGIIQLDDVYWGGELHGDSRGRGSENKTPFVVAVATNEAGQPIAMNMNVVEGFRLTEISRWAKQHLQPECTVVSDGLACFSAVKEAGCEYKPIITGGGAQSMKKEEFYWVNTMIADVKNSITGAYHAISSAHLPRYLAEFCYRFNRRFNLRNMFPRFVYIAIRTFPMPNRLLSLAESYGMVQSKVTN